MELDSISNGIIQSPTKKDNDYFLVTRMLDAIDNLMLGDFNKNGNYCLSQQLIDQLVKLTKVYQYSYGNTTFCESKMSFKNFGVIEFAIKFGKDDQTGEDTATLQLLETISKMGGKYKNTNVASIQTFKSKNSASFLVDAFKYFNVYTKQDEGFLNKEFNDDVDLIVAKKMIQANLKQQTLGDIEKNSQLLYERRLSLLEKAVIGKIILDELKKASDGISPANPRYYLILNALLDGIIELYKAEVLQDVVLSMGWNKLNEKFATQAQTYIIQSTKALESAGVKNIDTAVQNLQPSSQAKTSVQTKASKPATIKAPTESAKKVSPAKASSPKLDKSTKFSANKTTIKPFVEIQKQPAPQVAKEKKNGLSLDGGVLESIFGSMNKMSNNQKEENFIRIAKKFSDMQLKQQENSNTSNMPQSAEFTKEMDLW